jgi:hypothetical protein
MEVHMDSSCILPAPNLISNAELRRKSGRLEQPFNHLGKVLVLQGEYFLSNGLRTVFRSYGCGCLKNIFLSFANSR